MVTRLNIYQIGAGGTGAWAARALAYGFVNMRNLKPYDIHWHIYDPDIIELKNQIRQPFLGVSSIGEPKAVYMMKVIYSILYAYENYKAEEIKIDVVPHMDLVKTPGDIPLFEELFDLKNNHCIEEILNGDTPFPTSVINVLMLCVDNTYTRKMLEEAIDEIRPVLFNDYANKRYASYFYIDTGNTDKTWVVTAVPMLIAPRIKYNEITLPDPMLSCAERAETTTVPQTTHMNMVSGAYVAKSVLELLNSVDDFYGYVAASIEKDEVLIYRRKEEVIAAINSFSDYRQFENWIFDTYKAQLRTNDEDLKAAIGEYNTRIFNRAVEYFKKAEEHRKTLEKEESLPKKSENDGPRLVTETSESGETVERLSEIRPVTLDDEPEEEPTTTTGET